MIGEAGFAALRRAATIVHAVPRVRARLRVGDEVGECRARADHHLCDIDAPPGLWGVGLRHDDATDVTLVYAEVDVEHREHRESVTVDLLQGLMADIAVRQLLDELSTAKG